jgi:hypothetical protein
VPKAVEANPEASARAYAGKPKTIGRNCVWVAKYLYMLLYGRRRGTPRHIGLKTPMQRMQAGPSDKLVRRTNIEFLPTAKVSS